jgi:tripartite ATP-independent transporter DctP family solute receptor
MTKPTFTRRHFLGTSLVALGATGLGGPARAATVIRWATVMATSHPFVVMMERVSKQVKDDTGGSLDIQLFPGGQLGSSRDIIEATSTGAIQLVDEGAAQFGQFVPQFSILEAPYIWRDPEHVRKVLSSPLLDEMNKQLVEKRGMRILGSTYYGRRHVTSGSKAIKTVDDMKGFKLRIPEVDTFRAMTEAWGAKPTPMNFGELYLALSQGAVDGEENPLPTIQSAKLYEVRKYLILTGHVITPRLIAINEAIWAALTDKERASLHKALAEHGLWQDNEIVGQESKLVDTFKAGGMTVIEPDLESFRKPVLASVPAKFESKWGKGTWDRIAAM